MTYKEKAELWLQPPFDIETQKEVQNLIDNDPATLEDSFYKNLEFGTGGMRGIMGVGTNRLNRYTYGQATQGLANYLNFKFPQEEVRVVIAYDVRHNSDTFAKLVADVLTANGIRVFLFEGFRPTPELSYAIRELNCHSGIVLTASHNPPEYNGFKVYWQDGGQIVPPEDKEIIEEVRKVNFENIQFHGDDELLGYIGSEIDSKFIDACVSHTHFEAPNRDEIKIVFTPLHGTSVAITPEAFQKAGFKRVFLVEDQTQPSGDFPTVDSPNPEESAALQMALDLANEIEADIVMGTDPDADRIGVAVRNLEGNMQILNGNQTNTILTYFLLKERQNQNLHQETDFIGSTIVTSDIFYKIAEHFQVECKVGLTGFKWIAKMIKDFEPEQKFVCGGEESFGFMVGDYVRDKDSVSTALLVAEIAAKLKPEGKSMYQYLIDIYTEVGLYYEALVSVTKKGKSGAEEIAEMMKNFRANPPSEIDGEKVTIIQDYQTSVSTHLETGEKSEIHVPKSNVLIFYTDQGTKVAARPSGTEPKIKFYFGTHSELNSSHAFPSQMKALEEKINRLKSNFGA